MPEIKIKLKKSDFLLFGGLFIPVSQPVTGHLVRQNLIKFVEKKSFGKVYELTDDALK